MGGQPTRPEMEPGDDITRAIEESLSQQPGGKDAPQGFMEAIRTGHKERFKSRKKLLAKFDLENQNVAEILVKLHSIRPPDSHVTTAAPPAGTIYPLSELFFFLRFFTTQQNYLEAPSGPKHPDWEVYSIYAQSLGPEAGVKTFLENKLENMTACGHLADTLLSQIYFENAAEAKASAANHPINALNIKSRLDDLKQAMPPDTSCVVRIEINGNHVYLLDLNTKSSARIESLIHIKDSSARYVRKDKIEKELESCRGRYDVFTVMEYNPQEASDRLKKALETCFSKKTLQTKFPMGTSPMQWTEILDFIYRINVASQVRGIGVFKTGAQYL